MVSKCNNVAFSFIFEIKILHNPQNKKIVIVIWFPFILKLKSKKTLEMFTKLHFNYKFTETEANKICNIICLLKLGFHERNKMFDGN